MDSFKFSADLSSQPSIEDDKNAALCEAERWFAEKGIEWQTLVFVNTAQRAQGILGIAGIVTPLLLGAGSLSAFDRLRSDDASLKLMLTVMASCALGSTVVAFVYAAIVLLPSGALSLPTPDTLVEDMFSHIDTKRPRQSSHRAVAGILQTFRIKNEPAVNRKIKQLKVALWALGLGILLSTAFVAIVAYILLNRPESELMTENESTSQAVGAASDANAPSETNISSGGAAAGSTTPAVPSGGDQPVSKPFIPAKLEAGTINFSEDPPVSREPVIQQSTSKKSDD